MSLTPEQKARLRRSAAELKKRRQKVVALGFPYGAKLVWTFRPIYLPLPVLRVLLRFGLIKSDRVRVPPRDG